MELTTELDQMLYEEAEETPISEQAPWETPGRRLSWRQHRRIAVDGSATMFLVDGAGELKIAKVGMRDASVGGIGIHLTDYVRRDQVVLLELSGSLSAWGSVRYCNPVAGGYHAGIQFVAEDDSRISGLTALAHKLGYSDRR
jgi:hypothetical protein